MSQSPVVPEPAPPPPHHHVTIEHVAWANVLEWVHLFRAFRLAINPAKITLAVLAIIALFIAGWLFDLAWGPQVLPTDIQMYQTLNAPAYQRIRAEREAERSAAIANLLAQANSPMNYTQMDELARHPRAAYRELASLYRARFRQDLQDAHDSRIARESGDLADVSSGRIETPAEREQSSRQAAARRLDDSLRHARAIVGRGVCSAFLDYELTQFDDLVENTLTFVRIAPVRGPAAGMNNEQAVSGGLVSQNPDRLFRSDTVAGCIANMTITGPAWLFTASGPLAATPGAGFAAHAWLYAQRAAYVVSLLLLAAFTLAIIAFVGGALCRLSALEFAGSPNQALADVFRYAGGRFWRFVKTPLLPFVILLGLGIAVAVVSLIGAIPWLGELIIGAGFVIFLAVGFIMMLLVLGILGGFNLLYPTLAAEGTDSFDAMSRAFAYVYTRPWRLLFYTIISLVYGIITFLFVSFAVYIVFALTHAFVGWGMSAFGNVHAWYAGVGKLDALWPMPRVNDLAIPTNYAALGWSEWLGAKMIGFWVFLLLAALGGYVVSFYFSSNTIIYFLLRRACDGQSLTDIYEMEAVPAAEPPAAPAAEPLPGPAPSDVPPAPAPANDSPPTS